MKKYIFYFSIFTVILILNFSCYFKKQEFTVQNFNIIIPLSDIDSSGIRFKYDVKLKHFFKNSPKYQIYAELFDQNLNKVFNSKRNNDISIFGNEENWDSIRENLQVFIPYDKINLPTGEHNVELRLKVLGKRVPEGYIFNKKIKINKPELFNYEEQQITVKNYDVSERNKEIKISIFFDFKFKAYQTIGISEKEDLKNCYLKANLYDKETGNLIQYVTGNPTVSKINTAVKHDRQYSFSIPYTNLKLLAGKHDIICKIHLTNKKDEDFGVLHEINFSFTLPQLYTVDLNMKSLQLINKRKYDASSVFGRIFTRKNKDNGKGFPDVFWKISAGNEMKFRSIVEDDSFIAYTGETSFIIEDNEKLQLSVWDEDPGIRDQLIGKMNIINKKGEFNYNFELKKFGNVECSFDFIKTKYDPWAQSLQR